MRSAPSIAVAAFAASLAAASAAGAQPAGPDPTGDFLQQAAGSDAYEIDAARVALIEAQDPQVRAFAQAMIRDHARTSQDLQAAAARSGLPPPPMAMTADQAQLLAALQSLGGPDFDKAYLTQQVLAHTSALVVEQGYARDGPDRNVRQAAEAAIPVISEHLRMAQGMKSAAGGT